MSVKKAIEKLDTLYKDFTVCQKIESPVSPYILREILIALDESEDMASKTVNGSSLGWMLDQIRKQEKRLMAVEKAYELERLEDIERRIGELDSKVARIIYETNCYEAIYGKPSITENPVTDEKPEQTLEDVNILTREYVDVDGFGVIEVRYKKQDHSKVSIDRTVAEAWFNSSTPPNMCDYPLINELKLALQR